MKKLIFTTVFSFLITSQSFPQWVWQNPKPSPYALHGIFFVDSLYGWAVGEFSTIIKTTNGGNSWFEQTAPLRTTLRKVFFSNREKGVIVGGDVIAPYFGSVLYTTNGGETWFDSDPVPYPNDTRGFNDLSFVSEQAGYIAGFIGVCKTTNMGISWQVQGVTGWATSIYFIDSLNGWVGNTVGGIFRTTNGGENWQQISDIHWTWHKSIKFISPQIGWVVGHGLYSNYAVIHKTTNGGLTWITQDSTLDAAYNDIEVFDSLNAIVVGDYGRVLFTSDGGNIWFYEGTNDLGNYTDIALQGIRKWIVGGIDYYFPQMYSSRTFGFSWEERSSILVKGNINQIDFSDSLNGWCAGEGGLLFKTTDAGNTWQEKNLFSIDFSSISNPTLADIFIAGQSGQLIKTTDGGISWQIFQLPFNYGKIKLKFFSRFYGYYIEVGAHNLYKTTDGGVSWTYFELNNLIQDFHFVDSLNGWVLINQFEYGDSYLLHTTNGGKNWIDSTAFAGISTFSFLDRELGFIIANGQIFKTTDAGQSWDYVSNIPLLKPDQLLVQDRLIIYMLTEDYYSNDLFSVYKSIDGGETWSSIRKYTFLNNIFLSNSKKLFGVGNYGQIISYDGTFTLISNENVFSPPNKYLLFQNFPNPFNPNTKISYQIPEMSFVQIKVYDVLGKEVATLVNEEKHEGKYEVEFRTDGLHLSSGIYLYRLQVYPANGGPENFVETKKMILLR